MTIQEAKEKCWDILVKANAKDKINKCRNCSQANKNSMYSDYNYNNVLVALMLKEQGWKVKPNEDIYAVDLLGQDPTEKDVAVECKVEFYPSNNFFFEFVGDNGKMKDYWTRAKDEQVYYAAVCGISKTLHLYDLTEFRKQQSVNQKFSPVDTKYNTTGFLFDKNTPYAFKVAVFSI